MNEQNKLILRMGMLYLFAILVLGLMVISEKSKDYKIPLAEKKIKTHVKEKYKSKLKEFDYGKTKRNKDKYTMTIYNKDNHDLYFTASYEKKKQTDTYKTDYVEGKTLSKNIELYLNEKLDKKLKKEKNNYDTYKIIYNTKLTNCTTYVKNKLLKKQYNLPIYTIYVEDSFNNNLKEKLTEIVTYTKKLNLTPKDYHIILNNKNNISKSLDIRGDSDIIETSIDGIVTLINNNDFNTLKKYNIKVKYLN